MKTDLSSKIKLEYIPERYFNPKGEVELASLTRKEKVYRRFKADNRRRFFCEKYSCPAEQ